MSTLARRMRHAGLAVFVLVALAAPSTGRADTGLVGTGSAGTGRGDGRPPAAPPVERACPDGGARGQVSCLALVRTDVRPQHGVQARGRPGGLGALDLRDAYRLPTSTGGRGATVAIVASFTLIPALLALLGDRVSVPWLRLRRSRSTISNGDGIWGKLPRLVMRRPLVSVLVTGAALVLLAIPALDMNRGTNNGEALPAGELRTALKILETDFSAGLTDPLEIVIGADRTPEVEAAMASLLAFLLIVVLAALLPAYGRARADYVIGTKPFTEQYVLASLIEQRLAADGLTARRRDGLGSSVIFNALAGKGHKEKPQCHQQCSGDKKYMFGVEKVLRRGGLVQHISHAVTTANHRERHVGNYAPPAQITEPMGEKEAWFHNL